MACLIRLEDLGDIGVRVSNRDLLQPNGVGSKGGCQRRGHPAPQVDEGLVVQTVVRQVRRPIASGPDLVEVLLGRRRGFAHMQKQQREQREVKLVHLPGAQQSLLVAKQAAGAIERVQQRREFLAALW